ncbi:MAG: DNA polymerase III subunit beta [Betaproteobacteria bacterium]|nr:DNA polymerase III subunit beta [Betaproteobacteria bacterium]
MKLIQAPRDALLKPLHAVTGIVERRHTLPILSNVLIERRPGNLNLTATDLEIQVITRSPCAVEGEDIAVTVSARKLQDILRSLPESAEVSLELTDNRLHVKAERSRFNLQTLPAQDFPRIAEGSTVGASFSVEQRALRNLLSLVQYAMAQQDIRYYLNGLLLIIEDGTITVVATDGHRLALATLATGASTSREEVIVPRKAVVELIKLLSESEEPVQIEVLGNQVRFSLGATVLVSKVVDGKFPDYKRVIPSGYQKQFQMDRQVLLQALQRAAILSNEKFRGVRWILSPDTLCIACTNTEQEEAQEELEIDYQGETLDIGFNVTYLTDVLSNLDAPTVACALGDANSSAVLTVPASDGFLYVVMPMRI